MDTMNKSVQTMSLEKVMSELKFLKSGGVTYVPVGGTAVGQQSEQISAGVNLNPPGSKATGGAKAAETSEWVDPNEQAKKKKEEDQHLLKPSDFFGM